MIILDLEQNKTFKIAYCMLNLAGVTAHIHEKSNKLDANTLKVGDVVGFDHDGRDIIGRIKRLNPKTVTLITNDGGGQWRVYYKYLYRVYDSDIADDKKLSEGRLIQMPSQ